MLAWGLQTRMGLGLGLGLAGHFVATVAPPTAPVLTRTSTAGTNRMTWSGAYTGMLVGTDYISCRWRVNGGAWTYETDHLFTSDDYLDSIDGAATFAWALFAAYTFSAGALVEVQEGVLRSGTTTWSTILSDTMAAAPSLPIPQPSNAGLFLLASDLTTLFQSNAGTTAVAANNDVVGYWGDKSSTVFHLTSAANDTTRPKYQVSGGIHWVEFDGSNDVLRRAAALNLWSASGYTIMIAMRSLTPATQQRLVAQGNTATTNTILQIIGSQLTTASSLNNFYRDDAGANVNSTGPTTYTAAFDGTDRVLTLIDDGTGLTAWLDGVVGTRVAYTRSGTFTMDRFGLGAMMRATASNWFPARVHGLAIWPGIQLNSTERAAGLTYFGSLQGRTL